MIQKRTWNLITQWLVVLTCALALKLYYSSASADQLRWILAPTTALVELTSGTSFEFESHSGYLSNNRSFLIAPACAGVNFLITAFLMLAVRRLLRGREGPSSWRFIPATALIAYLVTIVANATRISLALQVGGRGASSETGWMNHEQLHRAEGIFVYFGFLLLLFVVSENLNVARPTNLVKQALIPLAIYYVMTLGIPLLNGGYHQGSGFWEHSVFVFLIPLLLVLPLMIIVFFVSFVRTEYFSQAHKGHKSRVLS